jgi:hypothetical protein
MRLKKVHVVTSIVVLVFVSCTQQKYPRQLSMADSLCNVHPDSAISLLKISGKYGQGSSFHQDVLQSPQDKSG